MLLKKEGINLSKFMNYNYINKSTGNINIYSTKNNFNNSKTLLINKNPSYNDVKNKSRNINYKNFNYNATEKNSHVHATQKILNQLKLKELELTKDLSKLISNEKIIKNESYLQLTNENAKNNNLEKIKLQSELKQMDENKILYISRLNEIKYRRNSLEDKLSKETGKFNSNIKEKLSLFLHNQNKLKKNDKFNARLKKLQKQNNKLFLSMSIDVKNKLKEKEEKLKLEEKHKKENNIKLLAKIKAEEKQRISLRKNKINEETKKLKKYINKKPKVKEYFYQKINTEFNEQINKKIFLEKQKRKVYLKSVVLSNLNQYIRNYEILKVKKQLELEEKTKGLKKSWSERGIMISKYKNERMDIIKEEEKNRQKEKQMMIDMKNMRKNKQINYSKKLEDNLIIDDIKKNHKKDKNKEKDSFRPNIKINYINNYCDSIRNKLLTKKSNEPKNLFKLRPINQIDLSKKQNSLDIIKDQKLKLPNISINDKNKINDNEMNNSNIQKNQKLFRFNKNKEIKNLIEKNGLTESTLELVNSKLENLKEKKEQKETLLKYQGGDAFNPDLGEEVCDILIDSVNAKMSLMDEMKKVANKKNFVDRGTEIDEYEEYDEEEYEN